MRLLVWQPVYVLGGGLEVLRRMVTALARQPAIDSITLAVNRRYAAASLAPLMAGRGLAIVRIDADTPLAAHAPGVRVGADPAAALSALRRLTEGATVAVTLGRDGAAWLDEGGVVRREAVPEVDVVETLGAGDVWHGAFAAAVAAGRPVPDAVGDANAAAALRCTRRGGWATLPDAAEVAALRSATDRGVGSEKEGRG
jgi:sugar/nucleoside kinase (ribokinase family)